MLAWDWTDLSASGGDAIVERECVSFCYHIVCYSGYALMGLGF